MFHRENVERVSARFEEKRRAAEREAEARTQRAEEQFPELKEVGVRMRGIAMRVLGESVKGGEDLPLRIQALQKESLSLQREYRSLLKLHGFAEDYTVPRRDCALCGDTGFIRGKMCTCLKKAIVLEGYRRSGIGKLLEKQRFDNFDLSYYSTTPLAEKRYSPRDVMGAILEETKEYAETFGHDSPSLLFIGGTGLGKTHLSSAIAGKVIEKGFDVVYESAPGIALLFEKDRFGKEEHSEEKIRRLFEAELLILDDLGTEPSSQTASSAIYQLINHRSCVASLPTVISTNLSYRQLEKRYDSAVLSRLLGEFEVKFFQGDDVRMEKLHR